MREIKFRVWYGKLSRMIYLGDVRNDTALWIEERGWDAVDHLMGKPESICSNYNNSNPENILMQFTGLLDKNGKEIYEGDIVKGLLVYPQGKDCTLPTTGSVEYCRGYAAFSLRNEAGQTLFHHHLIHSFEVIGNIYENPELTK